MTTPKVSRRVRSGVRSAPGKYEARFLDFISRHVLLIGLIAVSVVGLLMRLCLFDAKTSDYSYFMVTWIRQLLEYDGISGIGQSIGEYNVPYMLFLNIVGRTPFNDLYEIKLLSVVFDYVCAFAILKIVAQLRGTKLLTVPGLVAYTACLLSPVVLLNSAYWAQCDSIYAAMVLLCLLFMMQDKYHVAMACFGMALSFKLQAVFFLPVIVIHYFTSKRMPAKSFLWIPVVYAVAISPALIAGRGLSDTLLIYFRQAGIYEKLTMQCPNLYAFINGDYQMFKNFGILLTLCILGVGAVLCIQKKLHSPEKLALLAVWASMVCVYFLPAMHERYAFLTCIFSLIPAFVCTKNWWLPVGTHAVCFCSYLPYLFKTTVFDMKYLAVVNLILLAFITKKLFAEPSVT